MGTVENEGKRVRWPMWARCNIVDKCASERVAYCEGKETLERKRKKRAHEGCKTKTVQSRRGCPNTMSIGRMQGTVSVGQSDGFDVGQTGGLAGFW